MVQVSNSDARTEKSWRVIFVIVVLAGSLGARSGHAAPVGFNGTLTIDFSASSDVGVAGKKLVIVDKLTAASKAKFVYVAKDTPADKGVSNDPTMISATFDAQITGLPSSTSAHFEMPQGSNWLVNKPTVAKYVNKSAPTGGGVKVSVIKPMKLLKMVAKSLGDSPVDIYQGGDPAESVDVATQYIVVDGGATRRHCGEFTGCKRKVIGGGTGAKVVCKLGTADASCGSSASTTTTTVSTSTTTTVAAPDICCGGGAFCAGGLDAAACMDAGGTPVENAVCDASGDCVSPPGTGGCCCEGFPPSYPWDCTGSSFDVVGCTAACADVGLTMVWGAVCLPDGTCAAP